MVDTNHTHKVTNLIFGSLQPQAQFQGKRIKVSEKTIHKTKNKAKQKKTKISNTPLLDTHQNLVMSASIVKHGKTKIKLHQDKKNNPRRNNKQQKHEKIITKSIYKTLP